MQLTGRRCDPLAAAIVFRRVSDTPPGDTYQAATTAPPNIIAGTPGRCPCANLTHVREGSSRAGALNTPAVLALPGRPLHVYSCGGGMRRLFERSQRCTNIEPILNMSSTEPPL